MNLSKLAKRYFGADRVHRLVATGVEGDLCFINNSETGEDPKYLLLTKGGKFAFLGLTGLVESIGEYGDFWIDTLVRRTLGRYENMTGETIDAMIDPIYDIIGRLRFENKEIGDLFNWRAQRVIARFEDFSNFYFDNDPVPEMTDLMNIVKVSEGCPYSCIFCSMPGQKTKIYPREKILENAMTARRVEREYHPDTTFLMDELFINSSDILLFRNQGHDAIQMVDDLKRVFSNENGECELAKIYAFMDVRSIVRTPPVYLAELCRRDRINRVLVGYETGDDSQAEFLNKPVTSEEKAHALWILNRLPGIVHKGIIMIGATGEGFYHNTRYHDSKGSLDMTIDLMTREMGRNGKILLTRYLPIPESELYRMHELGREHAIIGEFSEGDVVPYTTRTIDSDAQYALKRLRRANKRVEDHYEPALFGRKRVSTQ